MGVLNKCINALLHKGLKDGKEGMALLVNKLTW